MSEDNTLKDEMHFYGNFSDHVPFILILKFTPEYPADWEWDRWHQQSLVRFFPLKLIASLFKGSVIYMCVYIYSYIYIVSPK